MAGGDGGLALALRALADALDSGGAEVNQWALDREVVAYTSGIKFSLRLDGVMSYGASEQTEPGLRQAVEELRAGQATESPLGDVGSKLGTGAVGPLLGSRTRQPPGW